MTDDQRTDKAAYLLKLITHPVRLRILLLLASNGEMTVTAIEQHVLIELALLSKCLNKLRDNGLLSVRRQERNMFYFLPEIGIAEGIKQYLKSRNIPSN